MRMITHLEPTSHKMQQILMILQRSDKLNALIYKPFGVLPEPVHQSFTGIKKRPPGLRADV